MSLSINPPVPVIYVDAQKAGAAYAVIAALADAEGADGRLVANAYWREHRNLASARFIDAFRGEAG